MHYGNNIYSSGEQLHNTGRIKITSGEQFVPLYLASIFPDIPNVSSQGYSLVTVSNIIYITYDTFTSIVSNTQSDKLKGYEQLRKQLKETLTSPLLKEYSLDMKENKDYYITTRLFVDIFSGKTIGVCKNGGSYARLGLYGTYRTSNIPLVTTSKYKQSILSNPDYLRPEVLVVVKAKHLMRTRASLLLKQAIEVPYPDIKVITTPDSFTGITANYIMPILKALDLKTEEVESYTNILDYLVKPKVLSRTADDYLSIAKDVVNRELNTCYA